MKKKSWHTWRNLSKSGEVKPLDIRRQTTVEFKEPIHTLYWRVGNKSIQIHTNVLSWIFCNIFFSRATSVGNVEHCPKCSSVVCFARQTQCARACVLAKFCSLLPWLSDSDHRQLSFDSLGYRLLLNRLFVCFPSRTSVVLRSLWKIHRLCQSVVCCIVKGRDFSMNTDWIKMLQIWKGPSTFFTIQAYIIFYVGSKTTKQDACKGEKRGWS